MPSIEEKTLRYLKRHDIAPGAGVLIAFSGGPDSTALLQVLHQLKTIHPLRLAAAYLDHGLRSVAELEEELARVRATCNDLKVQLEVGKLSRGYLREVVDSTGRSLEEAARVERYRFLQDCASRLECRYVALGHTADDQIETLIMRFFQGSWIAGLSGIPPRRGKFIRPLLECTRQEILAYLAGAGRSYTTDSTNLGPGFLRNKIRLRLIPALEGVFPGFRRSLLALPGKMVPVNTFLEQESAARLSWEPLSEGFRIDQGVFLSASEPLRILSLFGLVNRLNREAVRIPYRFLSRGADPGRLTRRRTILAGYGIRLYRKGRYLFLVQDIVPRLKKGYFIVVKRGRQYTVPTAGLDFIIDSPGRAGEQDRLGIHLRPNSEPIVLRSRRSGDSINIEGGSKKVKKLLAEWNVPPQERWKIPVVEDKRGIVAVLGAPLGYANRFRPQERGKGSTGLSLGIKRRDTEEM